MYKDFRYINAGENEVYRWGKKARGKVTQCLLPNKQGFYTIPADGGRYWTIGTCKSQYGEFARFNGVILPVNSWGYVWCKVGSKKEDAFVAMVNNLLDTMKAHYKHDDDDEFEEEE